MKTKILMAIMTLLFSANMMAQEVYTTSYDKEMVAKAQQWVEQGEWRNGFTAADPDSSVNVVEFYQQYQKNPEQWTALFKWLATTDLLGIEKGKHPIEGTSLVASVEDSDNSELENRRSESHYHHIDFQYVVKGIERFAVLDHNSSTPNCEYQPDVIHYDYDVAKTRFFDSATDKFIIFFPCDWHIAKINNDTDDQTIRVIVIKVEYVD